MKPQWDSNKKPFYSAKAKRTHLATLLKYWLNFYEPLGCSRKNPNREEIPGKMKLHPWKFHKLVLYLSEFPRPETKQELWKSHIIFLWSPLEIPLLFHWSLEFQQSCFFSNLGNSMSSTPLFFWNNLFLMLFLRNFVPEHLRFYALSLFLCQEPVL